MRLLLPALCFLSLLCLIYTDTDFAYDYENYDACSEYTSCDTCMGASNVSTIPPEICYWCDPECKSAISNSLIVNDCELSNSYIGTCAISGLGIIIVLGASSLCVCCICCGCTCLLCLCCIAACNRSKGIKVVNQEVHEELLGEEREKRRDQRKMQTKLVMEKYGKAV
ncbi:hypothetical protein LOD99_13561 [Oopsacas minuta]|uniref:Pituitary tumor-transforming gene 1 protein-interacting protein n=1 Tax=Oopsacas minuta TaxID=111878 RepID=A0AAV7KHK8_9METZ|nr:hypothetical protein LOD99_13561 [Oopsacas minuta]